MITAADIINRLELSTKWLAADTKEFMECKYRSKWYAPLVLDVEKCSIILRQIIAFYKSEDTILSINSTDDLLSGLVDITITIEAVMNMLSYLISNEDSNDYVVKFVNRLNETKCDLTNLIMDIKGENYGYND